MEQLWDDAVDGGGWDGCTVPSMGWNAAAGGVRALRLNPEGERILFLRHREVPLKCLHMVKRVR